MQRSPNATKLSSGIRETGAITVIAAIGLPWGSKIGAATQWMPSMPSARSMLKPRSRDSSSSRSRALRVRAAPLDQPKEPCREDVRPAQVGHHGLGGIGVEAA